MAPKSGNKRRAVPAARTPSNTTAVKIVVNEVLDGKKEPIPFAKVTMTDNAGTVYQVKPQFEWGGIYAISNIPSGIYTVEVFKDRYGPVPATG